MSNVIKPEQLQSSQTPIAGEIPVLNTSGNLSLPSAIDFTTGNIRIESSSSSNHNRLILHSLAPVGYGTFLALRPAGTTGAGTSYVEFRNNADTTSYGTMSIVLDGTNLNIEPGIVGGGLLPTTFTYDSYTIWHANNMGPGSGLNSDKLDGYDATSVNNSLSIPVRDSNKTIFASIFNSDITTGTPPLTITSRTMVPNLNADLVDGFDASTSPTKGQIPVSNATTGALQLVNGGASESAKLLLGRTGSGTYATYGTISTTGQAGASTGMVLEVNNSSGTATPAMIIASSGTVTFPYGVTFTSTSAFSSTTPFTIAAGASGTIITNLNSDKLDGYHSNSFHLKKSYLNNATNIPDSEFTILGNFYGYGEVLPVGLGFTRSFTINTVVAAGSYNTAWNGIPLDTYALKFVLTPSPNQCPGYGYHRTYLDFCGDALGSSINPNNFEIKVLINSGKYMMDDPLIASLSCYQIGNCAGYIFTGTLNIFYAQE